MVYLFRQAQSRDRDKRTFRHTKKGGNISKHRSRISLRAGIEIETCVVFSRGLHL